MFRVSPARAQHLTLIVNYVDFYHLAHALFLIILRHLDILAANQQLSISIKVLQTKSFRILDSAIVRNDFLQLSVDNEILLRLMV